jgi:hypothetical protein
MNVDAILFGFELTFAVSAGVVAALVGARLFGGPRP